MRVGILNIGLSNLFSIASAVRRLGAEAALVERPDDRLDALIFPGVGNFIEGVQRIQNMRGELVSFVKSGRPFLGICLGLQMLFEMSEEGPGKGLEIFEGKVRRLNGVKTPHMGWNTITPIRPSPLTNDIRRGEYVYFMHSYAPHPTSEQVVVAVTNYGGDFPSILGEKNVFGLQFHPEKSGNTGEKILRSFLKLVKS